MGMRTLGGRLDTKISIIMNVFHAHLGGFSHTGSHVNDGKNGGWGRGGERWDGSRVYKRFFVRVELLLLYPTL